MTASRIATDTGVAAGPVSTQAGAGGALPVLERRPRWVVPVLIGIAVAAAVLYTWNIGYSGLSTYYAAGAKSMTLSWQAFFFGALDPSATTTLDKLSGFLVPQAISAKIFGFHAWSLSLPQAVEGVITVIASYRIGTRWRGHRVGVATAAIMAFTPMLAAMFGRPMEDGMLTMCLVLAFGAWQRSVSSGRLGWLIVSGAWVAVGFQAKMMQAWLILPALAIGYLVASRLPRAKKLGRLAIVGGLTLVLSLSWMTAIQLVPSADRPYIDGTTNDNTYSMVFGYNGFDRIVPGLVPGAVGQLDTNGSGQSAGSNRTASGEAGHSRIKLVLPEITTQIGWLYPAAAGGILLALWPVRRRRARTRAPVDRRDVATTTALAVWLVVTAGVLSLAFVPHATYFAVIALPLAVLAAECGAEAVALYRRRGGPDWIVLPSLCAVQAAWTIAVVLSGPAQLHLLAPIVAVLGFGACAALVVLRSRGDERVLRPVIAVVVVSALLAPTVWSLNVLVPGGGGSASDAFAGPRPRSTVGRPVSAIVRQSPTATPLPLAETSFVARLPFGARPDPVLTPQQERLLDYTVPRDDGRTWLFASDTMAIAVSFILDTDQNAMPMGGFSRQAPNPSVDRLRQLIRAGRLRFVLLAVPSPLSPAPPNAGLDADRSWVRAHCTPVLTGSFRDKSRTKQVLYDCAPT